MSPKIFLWPSALAPLKFTPDLSQNTCPVAPWILSCPLGVEIGASVSLTFDWAVPQILNLGWEQIIRIEHRSNSSQEVNFPTPTIGFFLYKTKNPFLKRKKWFLAKMGSFKVFIVQNDEKNKFRSRLRAWINLILPTDPLTVYSVTILWLWAAPTLTWGFLVISSHDDFNLWHFGIGPFWVDKRCYASQGKERWRTNELS